MGDRRIVERCMHAVSVDDFDTQDVLIHDDYLLVYPQSGERIRGRENRRALVEGYPGRQEGGLRPTIDHITGTDDEWITKASWPARAHRAAPLTTSSPSATAHANPTRTTPTRPSRASARLSTSVSMPASASFEKLSSGVHIPSPREPRRELRGDG